MEKTLKIATDKYNNATPIFHSDRGSSYTREAFKHRLNELGFVHSMSRVSRCIDNGPMESFQGIMKDEMRILYTYKTIEEFCVALKNYLHFYINIRPQKRFNGKTPAQVREEATKASQPKKYPMLINYEVKKYWESIKENTS